MVGRPCLGTAVTSGSWPTVGCSLGNGVRQSSSVCFDSPRTLSSTHVVRRRCDDGTRGTATQHVAVTPPRLAGLPAPLPPNCRVRRGQGRGGVAIFGRYDVNDGILVEVQCG